MLYIFFEGTCKESQLMVPINAPPPHANQSGWQAHLSLRFSRRQQRTLLNYHHLGPLQVQRPFYPETDGTCHVYILHPPGGVVAGDVLRIEADLTTGSQALLTTPAASKFYRSTGAIARQMQILRTAAGATLEWLPQETILFNRAQVRSLTRIELSGDANFIGWEILCLGRPAADEAFTQGSCWQRFEIWRDAIPLYIEHGRYEGGSELLRSHWGLQGQPVTASLVCITRQTGLVEAVRTAVAGHDALFSASYLQDVLVCRYLGTSVQQARALFGLAWSILRPAVLGKVICPPRIWST
jgi:urease accessory protein